MRKPLIELLLKKGADPKVKNLSGISALDAAKNNTVGYRFSEDLYVGYDEYKESLLDAAQFGDIASVKQRIAEGSNLNEINDKGKTALHLAAEHKKLKVVRLLVESNASLNLRDKAGHTALETAACFGLFEMTKLLVENGADIISKDNDGHSVLYWGRKHPEIVDYLNSKGASE